MNYYQNESGLSKEDSEESAHELSGEGKEESSTTEETPKEKVIEPLPELVNSEWYECKVQIYDIVFTNDWHMTEEDIRKIVGGSAYDVDLYDYIADKGQKALPGPTEDGESQGKSRGRRIYRCGRH